jgi:mono/diheme cytochrome c family protein
MPDSVEVRLPRSWQIATAVVLALGVVVAIYMLKPVTGPARNLTLAADTARGTYLISLGGCVSCHTDHKQNGAMLAGGEALRSAFGTFYPPNITPDKQTGIGNWTLARFSDALSNGDSPHGNLYPIFPYDDFTLMSDQDIVDLYAGIMAVPPVHHAAPPNAPIFPLNFRLLVAGWKNLFFSPHRFQPDPTHSANWNRGAFLANGPGHCVACHSPHNALGAIVANKQFTGNPVEGTGGKAPPLTSAVLLAEGYTPTILAVTLKTSLTPSAGAVGAEMGQVVSDETSHWTDADLASLADYLLNISEANAAAN